LSSTISTNPADAKLSRAFKALFDFAESRFGGIDVPVKNASSPDRRGQLTGWFESIQVELLGPMRATLLALEAMRRRGGGAIVNLGSTFALGHGTKHSPWPSYDCGKMAIMRLTTTLAPLRDQENIRVNCLAPSWVASTGPQGVLGEPDAEQRKQRGVLETLIHGNEPWRLTVPPHHDAPKEQFTNASQGRHEGRPVASRALERHGRTWTQAAEN
jgi:NAD(P)-dependent dehydrogenase (short-subunit alcohol dehydrogenase family)